MAPTLIDRGKKRCHLLNAERRRAAKARTHKRERTIGQVAQRQDGELRLHRVSVVALSLLETRPCIEASERELAIDPALEHVRARLVYREWVIVRERRISHQLRDLAQRRRVHARAQQLDRMPSLRVDPLHERSAKIDEL